MSDIPTDRTLNVAGKSGFAFSGYDPVSFWTENKAVHGAPGISAEHGDGAYLFSSETNKEAFLNDPEKYLPEFGGYCAFGVSAGILLPIDVSTWQIQNGKLYCVLNPEILKMFNEDFDGNVAKAEANWPELGKK